MNTLEGKETAASLVQAPFPGIGVVAILSRLAH